MSQDKSETAQLIALLQKQIELQQAQMANIEEKQQEQLKEQQRQHNEVQIYQCVEGMLWIKQNGSGLAGKPKYFI
jgi:hypothetical protein